MRDFFVDSSALVKRYQLEEGAANDELNAAAVAEGLRVENPNLHP